MDNCLLKLSPDVLTVKPTPTEDREESDKTLIEFIVWPNIYTGSS